MTELELETKIRDAFDSEHVPSPGLEDRVIAAMPWREGRVRRERVSWTPRFAGAFVVLLALALIAVLVAPAILSRLGGTVPSRGVPVEPPAYSLAAVTGDYVFIVQRGQGNALLESADNGRTWTVSLRFAGLYGGTQMFGDDGFVWSLGPPPDQTMTLYRTADGGTLWSAMPTTAFPVEDVFFLDATHGWADSAGIGLNSEVLYATVDGGATWTRVGPLPAASPPSYVYGVGNNRVTFSRNPDGSLRGWYVGATQLFSSTDAGKSWHPVAFKTPAAAAGWTATVQQPAFADAAGVVVVGYHDPQGADNATSNLLYLYPTSDGGATWGDPVPGPAGFAPVGNILSTAILDPQRVWLTSQSLTGGDSVQSEPAVARTSNGGRTWQVATKTQRILRMIFLDPLRGYALDVTGEHNVNGILRTTDAGATWQRVTVPVFPAKS